MNGRRLMFALAALCVAGTCEATGAGCSVTGTSLVFGPYDPFRAAHTDSTANIVVSCAGKPGDPVIYSLALSAGGSRTFAGRRMRSHHSTLHYNIYTNAARGVVWGDGNTGTALITDSFILPTGRTTRNYAVYGRIFGRQNARVGTYTDSIVVTLNF